MRNEVFPFRDNEEEEDVVLTLRFFFSSFFVSTDELASIVERSQINRFRQKPVKLFFIVTFINGSKLFFLLFTVLKVLLIIT